MFFWPTFGVDYHTFGPTFNVSYYIFGSFSRGFSDTRNPFFSFKIQLWINARVINWHENIVRRLPGQVLTIFGSFPFRSGSDSVFQ